MQTQLPAENSSGWNSVSFLTTDPSLRDALFQSDVVSAGVQVLGRRGVGLEVAVQCCLVCCDLMYNPFPVPDERFVKQFLSAGGPQAVLDRLDNRGLDHAHSMDGKEVSHLQSLLQGQLQTRQQQLDFNTAFILLPIMAMAETPLGRAWFAEATHQQRLAGHLRRLNSYRELLQLVNLVQQEVRARERVKLDRVAIVERFVTFFKTLENKDHEEKVRELLELEEREKSRKEKKREKKRQQRLKQKQKTRPGEAPDDPPPPAPAPAPKDAAAPAGSSSSEGAKARSQPLDALDDIPLTVGPDGVKDVPEPAPVAPLPPPPGGAAAAQDAAGSGEDDWVMVGGGKHCYPVKAKPAPAPPCAADPPREPDPVRPPLEEQHRPAAVHAESKPSGSSEEAVEPAVALAASAAPAAAAAPAGFPTVHSGLDSGGLRRPTPPPDPAPAPKANKGVMRWADVARNGNTSVQPEEPAVVPAATQNGQPASTEKRSTFKVIHTAKESYHEQFPPLGQQASVDDTSGQQTTPNDAPPAANPSFDVLGATHQFLEDLCNMSGFGERAPRAAGSPGQSSASQAPSGARLDPSMLYEALTGWMWQAAVAQGLITPDTDPPCGFPPLDLRSPLGSQFLKPRAATAAAKPQASGVNENQPGTGGASASESRSVSFTSVGVGVGVGGGPGSMSRAQHAQTARNEPIVFSTQPSSASAPGQDSVNVKDWFDMTGADIDNLYPYPPHQSAPSRGDPAELVPGVDHRQRQHGTQGGGLGIAATGGIHAPPHALSLGSAYCSQAATAPTEAKVAGGAPVAAGGGRGGGAAAEEPFLWGGAGGFSDWLPTYSSPAVPGVATSSSSSSSSSSSRVCGRPVLDANDLYGLPLASSLENPGTLEFPAGRHPDQGPAHGTGSERDCLGSASACRLRYPEGSEERLQGGDTLLDAPADDHLHPFSVFGLTPSREGLAERDYGCSWLYQESPGRPKIKTAVVSVPMSSDSNTTTTLSSSTELRSEALPEDAFSLTPDTSRSNCVNNYDSFHQLSPSNSAASSFTGLHECLAPGFLRAASGDRRARLPRDTDEDFLETEEIGPSMFRPVVGNIGLLPAQTRATEAGSHTTQCPDLSTVPEREQSLGPGASSSSSPRASRVVGHGRPRRSGVADSGAGAGVDPSSDTRLPAQSVSGSDVQPTAAEAGSASSDSLTTPSEQAFARPAAERPESPEILFPESLREEGSGSSRCRSADAFPSIHEMSERDLFQDVFSNSFFLEQIAIDQIRRRFRAMGGGEEVLRTQSILFHDLDYYASLYGVRLRDILGPPTEAKATRPERAGGSRRSVDPSVPGWKALVKELGRKMNSKEDLTEPSGDPDLSSDSEDPAISDWPWNCKVLLQHRVCDGPGTARYGRFIV